MSLFDRFISSTLPFIPKQVVHAIANPYIAGETIDHLLTVIEQLNADGYIAAAGMLGEFIEDRTAATEVVGEYEKILAAIQQQRLDSNIHVKPTHLGLKLDKEFCYQNIRVLVQAARARKMFLRIDTEDSSCVDDTLDIHARLREEFDNVGAVVQANLRRSPSIVRGLSKIKANVRLCKGAYIEPAAIAYQERKAIQDNYTSLLEELLSTGCYVGIATHDETLVREAFRIIDRLGLDPSQYEFQMLLGVGTSLRRSILEAGHRLRVAVPFGPEWYPYSIRRLRSNPMIARHVLKAMLSRERWA